MLTAICCLSMETRRPRTVRRAAQFDSLEQEVYLNVWRTYDRLRALEDELFAQFDLTPQQYNALRLLQAAGQEAVPTLVLAGRLVSRAPDITRLLDKLERRQLIARERLPDNRRVVAVRITAAGTRLLDEIAEPRPLRDILGRFVDAAPAEREHFTLVLENGQAFSADDIFELVARPDSPFR